MVNLPYLVPRLVRHFVPESLARWLLRRGWLIRPGLETRAPLEAVRRYHETLQDKGAPVKGKRVLIFGYGGSFAVGCGLLRLGARHVVLAEKAGYYDEQVNRPLLAEYGEYLHLKVGHIEPDPQWITVFHGDILSVQARQEIGEVDIVLSSSVYEHLDAVEEITHALVSVTAPDGVHLHYIDLRDHFFRYPFEMLCYSEDVWRKWLDPSSHHNRWRMNDYRRLFEKHFSIVSLDVLARDEAAFENARPRIRGEFLTGDELVDSVTLLQVFAKKPMR
jgi:hypothetical protein